MQIQVAAVLLSCCLAWDAGAQQHRWDADRVPRHAVKFSPFHLLNFYPTIQVSYETRLIDRFTLQVEGGYVLERIMYAPNPDILGKRGFKAKVEPRYYFGLRRSIFYYAAPEFYMNAINFDRKDSRQECFDLDCTRLYSRTYNYEVRYREHGYVLKSGFMVYFSRFLFDFKMGVMVRVIRYDEPAWLVPEFSDGEFFRVFPVPNEEDRVALSPALGIRFGYRLR